MDKENVLDKYHKTKLYSFLNKISTRLLTFINILIFVVFVGIGAILIYQGKNIQAGINLIFMWAFYMLFVKIDKLEGAE